MRQGDLVVRKSYGGDVVFKIQGADGERVLLKGVEFRLLADSPASDLSPFRPSEHDRRSAELRYRINRSVRQLDMFRRGHSETRQRAGGRLPMAEHYFEVPGTVLHLDGDPNYLRKCLLLYKELRIPAAGYYVSEPNMALALQRLLPQVKPDIVVLTGHDGLLKQKREIDIHSLASYKNSHHFVNAVHTAREYERSREGLVVVAGACQSHFEALLYAGANFASSPGRVLIHALDPLYVASKVAFTPFKDTVQLSDVLPNTLAGLEGVGGVETRGCFRLGLPNAKWVSQNKEAGSRIGLNLNKM
ncbi:sporulation peptidase YabG [Paenibacillus aurantius]|uniref:Sporulation peptidase YabG n=1 Tax=Paenibacillus aurantius TaxID=2918900 RepID=A0AA96LCX3_9BACL|nr:sporulation peptidase YabG [Paenibacillus aurantius]WNQ11664.1 sporulation peptidase YabG [Paenibacillus aurantius]